MDEPHAEGGGADKSRALCCAAPTQSTQCNYRRADCFGLSQEANKFVRLPEVYVKGNNVCLLVPYPKARKEAAEGRKRLLTGSECNRSNTYESPTRSSMWSRSSRTASRATSEAAAVVAIGMITVVGAAAVIAADEAGGAVVVVAGDEELERRVCWELCKDVSGSFRGCCIDLKNDTQGWFAESEVVGAALGGFSLGRAYEVKLVLA